MTPRRCNQASLEIGPPRSTPAGAALLEIPAEDVRLMQAHHLRSSLAGERLLELRRIGERTCAILKP